MIKPDEILKLEKHFDIILYPESDDPIKNTTYTLSDNQDIIGLSINFSNISDISILKILPNLSSLTLSNNEISDISVLKNLTQLKYLNLSTNKISNILALKNLIKLEYLSLWENEISNIEAVKKLVNLQTLDFWNNYIVDISPLKNLIKLVMLDLDGNKISDISHLKNLNQLHTLFLNRNEISDISILSNLSSLETLSIESNQITHINILKKTQNLLSLSIGDNPISDFSIINQLSSLIFLSLNRCHLSDISFLKNSTNLSTLYLSNNQLSNISVLENFTNLKKLNLSYNQITNISSLTNLTQLTTLNLENNQIRNISFIKDLTNLILLNLSYNQIIDIRALIKLIENGISLNKRSSYDKGLHLKDNPLEYPPLQTLMQGNDAVMRFFKKINEEGIDSIFEAKLTLVGEGSAGKTSLLKRLLDSTAKLPEEKKRTRGISIEDWEFKKQKNKKHIAHIWDFGGQDVYYPVHRFFLTENSVFVLMASSRQNTHHFDYWIPTIYQFGGRSPIILGQTCHEGNTTPWNDIGAYIANDNFNIIKDQQKNYHEINLPQKNKGLAEIKKSIINQILILPHYKKNVPKSWLVIRELINNLKKENCISYLDLKKRIMNSNPESFRKKEDVDDCIKFFHSIGVLLWYDKEHQLKNWVVLNPKWSVDAVYRIIDDQKILRQKGIILSSDFERVWNKTIYEDKHEILKEMLEVFKIAFPKKHNKSDYIMPTRLQSIPPENIWHDSESCLRIEYRYEFMPKGMINQISAELSRYIIDDDQVWNNGVNFCEGETTCQVLEDFYNRKITVKAKGNDARSIIMIIMNAVKDISEGYKGVNPKIIIPCICKECTNQDEKSAFSYEMLLEKIKKNKDAIVTCNTSDEVFKIDNLLFKIGLPNPLKEVREEIEKIKLMEKEKNAPTKIFVTYSWSDENEQFDQNHQNKVGKFVNQLRTNWNLDASFDLHKEENNFMKMMYENLSNNNKIVIVLSKGYAVKANSFKGGVGTEYERIINDIKERPQKYILVSFDKRNNSIYPFGFQGSDVIEIVSELVSENLPDAQNRLLAKLTDESLIVIPELGGKTPKVTKKVF